MPRIGKKGCEKKGGIWTGSRCIIPRLQGRTISEQSMKHLKMWYKKLEDCETRIVIYESRLRYDFCKAAQSYTRNERLKHFSNAERHEKLLRHEKNAEINLRREIHTLECGVSDAPYINLAHSKRK